MTLSTIPADLTGEHIFLKETGDPERPSRAEIARLSYDFSEMRGRRDGHDVDDWLTAERELVHHYR
jgi:hypothetical protein